MKRCLECKIEKSFFEFHKDSQKSDGYRSYCKDCRKIQNKKTFSQRQEYKKKYYKKRKNDPEYIAKKKITDNRFAKSKKRKEYQLKWYKENKEKFRLYRQKSYNKRKNDPLFILEIRLRGRLRCALKRRKWKKDNKFIDIIGCDRETLVKHIESQFQPGMSWENRHLFHIDHIIPLSSAKTKADLYRLSHYTNLQPLWVRDNLLKSDKIWQVQFY